MACPRSCAQFVEPCIDHETLGNRFEAALVCLNGERSKRREIVGPLERLGESAKAVHAALDEQLLGRVQPRTEQHVSCDRPSEFVTRTFDRPLVDGESELGCGNPEPTGCRRHPQIARKCQLGAGTHRRSVHGRQGDARQLRESAKSAAESVGKLVAFDTGQVGPRTKGRRLARQDDNPRSARHGGLMFDHATQGREVDRVPSMRTPNRHDGHVGLVPVQRDGSVVFSAGAFFSVHLYHRYDCMTSGLPSPSSPIGREPIDPVRARRAQVAKYTLLANRLGYLLYAATTAFFAFAFAVGFNGVMVGLMTFGLVGGSILLAPSIVLGYAVKAAEREDREREQAEAAKKSGAR